MLSLGSVGAQEVAGVAVLGFLAAQMMWPWLAGVSPALLRLGWCTGGGWGGRAGVLGCPDDVAVDSGMVDDVQVVVAARARIHSPSIQLNGLKGAGQHSINVALGGTE